MIERDECLVCGEPLVKVRTQWASFWRHIKTSKNFKPHRPWAAREFEEAEKRRKEKYCFDEHPKFQMVFCRLKPEHEGNHRSRSGIEWEPIVSVEKARAEREEEI